jgi:hypothetical protein
MLNPLLSSSNSQAAAWMVGTPAKKSVGADRLGRLIQMSLAIYLIPVLVVVVVISSVGMMILGISETIHGFNARLKRITPGSGRPGYYR